MLILLDGSDSFSVQSGYSAASIVSQNYSIQLTAEKIERAGAAAGPLQQAIAMPITSSIQVLYNPDLRDLWFILPAIIGMILQSMAVVLAAMAVVREREAGTLEQILATPTRPLELIVGKMIPLLVLCLIIIGITLGLGVFWFGVPFSGESLAVSMAVAPVHHLQPGPGSVGFDDCQEPATGPTDYPNAYDLQHASYRPGLSA